MADLGARSRPYHENHGTAPAAGAVLPNTGVGPNPEGAFSALVAALLVGLAFLGLLAGAATMRPARRRRRTVRSGDPSTPAPNTHRRNSAMPHHTIALVGPDPADRDALRRNLERDPRLAVVAEAASAHEVLDTIDVRRPRLALVDARLPGLSGFLVAAALGRLRPDTRVILRCRRPDDDCRVRAVLAGAAGVLPADAGADAVLDAVRAVLRGRPLLPGDLLAAPGGMPRLLGAGRDGGPGRDAADGLAGLSLRELEVLDCLVMGYSNREIGRALFLAEQTVKNLASALLGKLGVPSRTAALRHAVANGWAEIGPAPRHAPAFARDPALLGGGGPSTRGL